MADFLFEIGLEEVPARMIAGAQAELQRRVVGMLERELLTGLGEGERPHDNLAPGSVIMGHPRVKSFATPRRLAVLVKDVAARQEDVAEELVGPSVKVAYKDGVPTPAAVAFAKKAGVDVAALKTVTNAKGEYLAATTVKAGRPAAEVIAAEMPRELAGIYWPKNMYWRAGRPERFVRPVRWMVAMLGAEVVPVSFGGYEAGAVTYGHRVLFGDAPITLKEPSDYEDALLSGFVIADVEARRQRIRKALDKVTRTVPDLRWREDHGLVDKLTQLTEWPSVLMGGFEAEYLALPEEVLVTVMRDHQSYFAVEDKEGKLAPHFLAVLNTETDEAGMAVIRHGNERVLRARFNDARFFWEFDQRVPLVERVALLEHVTFQKDLGSYAAKTERMRDLSHGLGSLVQGREVQFQFNALLDAASLAKTDLTTELVKEFTELQGVVGGLYARTQGFSAAVSDAIYDQYKPESMEDSVPRTVEGSLLAIVDKADTIAGMFGLGLEPTGSKDPFALRRAANGIVKILAESGVALPLTLDEVSRVSASDAAVAAKVRSFFAERLEFYLREARGQAYDVVKAVLAAGSDDVRDTVARAEAVSAVRGGEDFAAVSSAFKRMKNIVSQARDKGFRIGNFTPEFSSTIESDFWISINKAGDGFALDCDGGRYTEALAKLAALRPVIDGYFNSTLVMVDDDAIRAHRLGTLDYLLNTFTRIADFSEIVVAG